MSLKASTQLRDNDHSASLSAMLAPDKERGLTILLIGIPFDWGEQSASWDLGRWGGGGANDTTGEQTQCLAWCLTS